MTNGPGPLSGKMITGPVSARILVDGRPYLNFYGSGYLALAGGPPIGDAVRTFFDSDASVALDPAADRHGALARLEAWGAAIKMSIDYPLGVGAGNFNSAFGRHYIDLSNSRVGWGAQRWISAHRIYFKVLGEFGVLGNPSGGLFIASANAVFHFIPGQPTHLRRRISPYVSGGYTRLFSGEGAFNAWTAGSGADAWLKPRVGLRAEFRDQVRPDSRGGVHYWSVRAGVVFR